MNIIEENFNYVKTELLEKYKDNSEIIGFYNSYDNINFDFWKLVEDKSQFVLYEDTDSMYIHIPVQPKTAEGFQELSMEIGKNINRSLELFCKYWFKCSNVDYNNHYYVDFKTEMAAKAILFIGVKKLYAYNKMFELEKKGPVIYKDGKIIYMGLPLKKVDIQQLIKDFMYDILHLSFNPPSKNKNDVSDKLYSIVNTYAKKNQECIDNLDLSYIGRPKKATNQSWVANSVNVYNTIMGKKSIFKGESIYLLPIIMNDKIKNKLVMTTNSFLTHSDTVSQIAIPFDFDKDTLKLKFAEFGIELNNQFSSDKYPRIFYTGKKETVLYKLILNIKQKYKI